MSTPVLLCMIIYNICAIVTSSDDFNKFLTTQRNMCQVVLLLNNKNKNENENFVQSVKYASSSVLQLRASPPLVPCTLCDV